MKKLKETTNESGQVLVLAALLMTVLMGFAAFAVDIGMTTVVKSKLQNTADAAALAGAIEISAVETTAENTAISYAKSNDNKLEDKGIHVTADYELGTVLANADNSSKTIEVVCTKKIAYSFAKILGFKDTEVSARAVAKQLRTNAIGQAADYTVFSEDELKWNGGAHIIEGDVYGGDGIKFNGVGNKITGVFNYNTGSVNFSPAGGIEGGSNKIDVIPMPDLSELIKAKGTVCTTQEQFDSAVADGIDGIIYYDSYSVNKKGEKTYNDLNIKGRISGVGIICATGGNITIKGDQNSTDSVTFYCAQGNITFNGGSGSIYGILYAPNGAVTVNGTPGEPKIYGRIIGKDTTVNGNGYGVYRTDNDLEGLYKLPSKTNAKLIQ